MVLTVVLKAAPSPARGEKAHDLKPRFSSGAPKVFFPNEHLGQFLSQALTDEAPNAHMDWSGHTGLSWMTTYRC